MSNLAKLTRRELYDLVWSTPMSQLAPRFGLSDHGLANICERHRVPTPPRGFWAKKEAGKKVKQALFASTDDPRLENIVLRGTDPLPDEVREIVERLRPVVPAPVLKPEPDAGVALPLGQIHMALRNTATALRRDKAQDGIARAFGPGLCGVEIGKAYAERAIRILDSLIRGLESAGLRIQPNERQLIVFFEKDKTELRLIEATRRVPHQITPGEAKSIERYGSAYMHKYDYQRTGLLRIEINGGYGPTGTKTKWPDGARESLEDRVSAIITDIQVYFDVRKLEREKEALAARKREEMSRRRMLAKKRDERDDARLAFVESLMERQAKARQLSSWLERLGPEIAGEQHAKMVAWARDRLASIKEELDPHRIEIALQQKKLFPAVEDDDLHDPLGDPPPGSIWGY